MTKYENHLQCNGLLFEVHSETDCGIIDAANMIRCFTVVLISWVDLDRQQQTLCVGDDVPFCGAVLCYTCEILEAMGFHW